MFNRVSHRDERIDRCLVQSPMLNGYDVWQMLVVWAVRVALTLVMAIPAAMLLQ